jgi:hypothetical protein
MTSLVVAPIVEGHGDTKAVPLLIRRICGELLGFFELQVCQPVRIPRNKIHDGAELRRAVTLAELKARAAAGGTSETMVIVIMDADDDLPCELGPEILRHSARPGLDLAVVIANLEYETWFVGASGSLAKYLDLEESEHAIANPEGGRLKKAWIQRHFRGVYAEAVDQEKLTAELDLARCRVACPSFDKLCRELERVVKRARARDDITG